MDAASKLAEARTRLLFARPYYATGAYALRTVWCHDVPALAVDRYWRLYANPGWVAAYDVAEVGTGMAHELHHLLLDHAGRAETMGVTEATRQNWNDAGDMDINVPLCRDCRAHAPLMPVLPAAWCLLPEHHKLPDGKSAEWYFHELLRRREPRTEGGAGQERGHGAGNGGRGHTGRGSGNRCGSGATGVAEPWELPDPESSSVDGLDDADAWDVRRRVALDVQNHAMKHGPGSVSGTLLDWSGELLRVKAVSWERLLGGAVRRACSTTAGAVMHSYARTSRRQHAFNPIIMPAYRRPLPRVTVISDTSSSMDEHRKLVRGVVDDVCRRLSVPLRALDVDVGVQREASVTSGRRAAVAGGGGTDMAVGIEKAFERNGTDCAIVITDCVTPWPAKRPRGQVIVAACGASEKYLAEVPSWATVVVVERNVANG